MRRRYAEDVLGMQALDAPDGALYLKMDERDFRYVIVPGSTDRYFASGWELPDGAAFDAALAALQRAGVEPVRATRDEAALRRVQAMAWCTDPSGNRHELYWGARCDFRRFVSPLGVSHFVTGDMGPATRCCPRRSSTRRTRSCAACSASSCPTSFA